MLFQTSMFVFFFFFFVLLNTKEDTNNVYVGGKVNKLVLGKLNHNTLLSYNRIVK